VLLESKEVESILESNLILDFVVIALVQQKDSDGNSYEGPGSIFQDKDGILQLKMYHKYESHEEINHELSGVLSGNGLVVGEIIEKPTTIH